MGQSTIISRVTTDKRIMALTFDDGSNASNLLEILSILAANSIKSTFFLTGEAVEAHPSLVREIINQGHEIGNHSYSHPEFTKIGADSIENEMIRAENAITRVAGINPKPLFRPPYGAYNQTVLNVVGNIGYTYTLMWTIDTIDWNGTAASTMISKVLNNAQPGAIVLMHVGGGTYTTSALPSMIEGLENRGYELTTISRMLSLTSGAERPMLSVGSTGSSVRYLQDALSRLGYNPGPIDGIFGPRTKAAVTSLQSAKGLVVDGIVGPITWAAIDRALGSSPGQPPASHPLIRLGSTGEAVRYLQTVLAKVGFNPGPVDGIFGPRTNTAVRAYQSSRGLVVDGIVGPKTWAAIDSEA